MKNRQNIRVISFDLDGTLVDSVPDLAAATQATLVELGFAACTEAQVRTWIGNGAKELVARAIKSASGLAFNEAEIADVMPKFMVHYKANLLGKSQLYPEVKEVLESLTEAGYQLTIITNKPKLFVPPLLKYLGIDHLFNLILGGDSLPRMKPDPLPIVYTLEKLQLSPTELLMVGDSRNDILAAKAAGVSSIGLTYGYNYGEDISLSRPDAVCDCFSDILAQLDVRQAVMER